MIRAAPRAPHELHERRAERSLMLGCAHGFRIVAMFEISC